MIQAVPAQSKQGMLPDECRAVDNNEPKGQNEIAAATSAVDDDRTTHVTEAASIPASDWSIRTAKDMPSAGSSDEVVLASLRDRGGRSTRSGASGTGSGWNQDETPPRFTRSARRFSFAEESN